MTYGQEQIAQDVLDRYAQASLNRGNWESHWEEIAERVLPHYATSFQGQGLQRTQGEKRTDELYDATAALALPRFAAAMEYMLTPRQGIWHRLAPSDPTLKRNRLVQMWFDEVNRILFAHRYAPKANYASQQYETYLSLGAFGSGCMFVDALKDPTAPGERGIRYRAIHLGEIYFIENHQGMIDTAMRRFPLKARQAVQRFNEAKLPEKITQAATDPKKAEQEFWFIHCVWPRGEKRGYDPMRKDAAGMAFASDYVCEEEKCLVYEKGGRETGYYKFPYPISRYVVAPGETYGRSPAMLALPSIKTLNEQKKTVLKQGHRAVDPVLLAYDDGIIDQFSLKPGAMNFGGLDAQGRELVKPLPVGNLALAKEMMEAERAVINDAFLLTLFQILVETPQMTATEVLERAREKGALLSPTMGRQQSEFLGPMIERELDVLSSQGLLPPMPQMLLDAAGSFDVIYESPLSKAQRAENASGLMRLVDWTREYIAVTQDLTPLDWIDWDQAMPDLADIQAVPSKWLRDVESVMKVREGRAQQAQQAQAVEALPAMAGAAKAMQAN